MAEKHRNVTAADKKITFLRTLFGVASNHGMMVTNLASRIPKPRDDSAQHEPFDLDDLRRLFASWL